MAAGIATPALEFDDDDLAAFFAEYGEEAPHETRTWFEELYEFF